MFWISYVHRYELSIDMYKYKNVYSHPIVVDFLEESTYVWTWGLVAQKSRRYLFVDTQEHVTNNGIQLIFIKICVSRIWFLSKNPLRYH